MRVGEDDAFMRDSIQSRSVDGGVTHVTGMEPGLIVGHENKDVGTIGGMSERGKKQDDREDAEKSQHRNVIASSRDEEKSLCLPGKTKDLRNQGIAIV